MIINSSAISDALNFYNHRGFELVTCPYIVPKEFIDETKPDESGPDLEHLNDKFYVASAEQGLIKEFLFSKKGGFKCCAISPCIRLGEKDETHFEIFLKIELFKLSNDYKELLQSSFDFMCKFIPNIEIVKTTIGHDIMSGEVELGSYGCRTIKNVTYSYGTGLAEPRFSMCQR